MQAAMMGYVRPLFAGHRWWVVCFIGLVAGNTIDIVFQIHYQHHNNIWRFLSNHVAKLDVLVNVGLLGLLLASIERLVLHSGHTLEHELGHEPHTLASAGLTWLWIAASACAGEQLPPLRQVSATAGFDLSGGLVNRSRLLTALYHV
jgi:hypothetical protein